ncbi:MAG: TetR/AcrR family transcriptional regulator [Chloroflexi bacterium]|nr:TetR/AcrR family transcriptional regulator [Chloroflexota bacterium]
MPENRLASRFPRPESAVPARQDRAVTRQERILDAALDVFAEQGYQQATVDDIASSAQTSKGGIYFHFPGKDAIFLALLDRSAKQLLARVGERVARESDPIRKVDAALLTLAQTFGAHRSLARLFLVEARGAGPRFHAQLAEVQTRFVLFLQQQLQEAVSQGRVSPFDVEVASQAWFGALNQVVIGWALAERPRPLEEMYPHLRALLLRSIGLDDHAV